MGKVALRGLLTRKLRSVLTGFAVVVGVAFVVGTLVFTDTIDESFKNLFERTSQGVDVSVEGRQAVDEFDQTVIMVTHEAAAASVADRIVILSDGQVVHDGPGADAEGVLDLMKAVG